MRSIAACTTLCSGVSQGQAFHYLLQLSVKLWSYNAKILLCHISLLPVVECDPLNPSFCLKKHPIPLASVLSLWYMPRTLVLLHPCMILFFVLAPEVSYAVAVCNRFASLSDECATLMSCLILSQVFCKTHVSPSLATDHALVSYPRGSTIPVLPPYSSTPAIPYALILSMEGTPSSWDTDIFMPKDDSFQNPYNEMDEVDKEINIYILASYQLCLHI